jgi:hypothetical protein
MKANEIELWARQVIQRVQDGRPVEDSRVELKSLWPNDPNKAARRLAGHANASYGSEILWVIGVDEKNGIVGVTTNELPGWYHGVAQQFDDGAPALQDINFDWAGKTVVGMLFACDRAPYVVKNAVHGTSGGGAVALEVPWREGTAVRSGNRANLLSILVPLEKLPTIRPTKGWMDINWIGPKPIVDESGEMIDVEEYASWDLVMEMYIVPPQGGRTLIPFHDCEVHIEIPQAGFRKEFNLFTLLTYEDQTAHFQQLLEGFWPESPYQMIVKEPGLYRLRARLITTDLPSNYEHDATVTTRLKIFDADRSVTITSDFQFRPPTAGREYGRWVARKP